MSKRYPGGIIRKTPPTPSQSSAQGIWDMASVTQAVKENNWPIAGVPDPISRSLRFRSSASAYLNRTPSVASNQKTFTISFWAKLGQLGTYRSFFSAGTANPPFVDIALQNTDELQVDMSVTAGRVSPKTTAVFRDPSAWYHFVVAFDTTQAAQADRVKVYVNGVQQTITAIGVAQNTDLAVNSVVAHNIGRRAVASDSYLDGYMAEVYFIDGQALLPSAFGSVNDQTGVGQPIAYTGTYGTNGFYLPFSNVTSTTTIGYDFSGNNNNWTANNISLTTGTSIQSFTTTGTTSWTAPTGVTSVNYLVVGGGGSGGAGNGGGGGGGAGGLRTGTIPVVPGVSYTVTVGAGGTGTSSVPYRNSGGNSVFGSIIATGGGGGGYDPTYPPLAGGSGGGGNYGSTTGGAGTAGQGFAGGNNTAASGAYGGGGGGGSSAVGADGTSSVGGNGGAGTTSSISGSSVTYAGGGGGGTNSGQTVGTGAAGGGNGGTNSGTGGNATANTGSGGGGGGGGSVSGGNGGSGIVILSWASGATTTYDSMVDVPTQWIPYNTTGDVGALWRGNYAVWNSLPVVGDTDKPTYSQGNLTVAFPSFGYAGPLSTISLPTQNTYCEITCASVGSGGYSGVGIAELFADLSGNVVPTKCVTYGPNGGKTVSGAFSSYGSSFTTGDIIGIAYDYSGNQVTFYKNNVSQGALSLSSLSGALFFCCHATSGAITWTANFGQRPFTYTPPVGFKTLNTTNLPTPTIGATASTTANKYFDATVYTGTNANLSIVNSGAMQPDFVWIKNRGPSARAHNLVDSVRGSHQVLFSNDTAAEATSTITTGVLSFASNGFNLGLDTSTAGSTNASGESHVAWQWRASNTTAVTNTAGSITSTVSANTTAGFSIVTYTGTGANATVGHGLGVAPSMIIIKCRTGAASNWLVYHQSLSANGAVFLNLTDAYFANSAYWQNTAPTSTVFSIGTAVGLNASTVQIVAYCFSQVAGYSAFGSYVGNASTDGPFVFTGFRPRYVMVKDVSADTPPGSSQWRIWDTSRAPYNAMDNTLQANGSNAEQTGVGMLIDSLSNGFKLRDTNIAVNRSGDTFIYMAFAESPFKYALAR